MSEDLMWWVPCEAGEGCPVRWHVEGADEIRRHPVKPGEPGYGQGQIVCPECGMASADGNDRAAGYCGNCHWWTSEPELWRAKRDEYGARRVLARRYFDERITPGLTADGMPGDGIGHLRRRYVRDVLGNVAVLGQLEQWAAERGAA